MAQSVTAPRGGNKTYRPGALSLPVEVLFCVVVGFFALMCVLPFLLVVIISFTDESVFVTQGYTFFPSKLTLYAYEFVFKNADQFGFSFLLSVFVVVAGTALSLLITALFAYPQYRPDYKYRNFFSYLVFFTTLFSGGLVPGYMVNRYILHLYNNIWVLILPGCFSFFNAMVMRTLFRSAVPFALVESAHIDGAGELRILFMIVCPLALPALATIGLFTALGKWNDWFTSMLFIENPRLYTLQYLLMKVENSMEWLVSNSRFQTDAQIAEAVKNMPRDSARMVLVVLVVLPIACAYPFFQRFFVHGLAVGSVKG